MKNPWQEISLDDYEKHMRLDSVQQLQAMNAVMKKQLEAFPADTAMILGIAGGNGAEHIRREKYRTVYGVDINEAYLRAVSGRYPALSDVMQCLHLDLTKDADKLPPAQLVIADLLIEYIGYPAFQNVLRQVRPVYVSCVIQINADTEHWVSDSPYLHAFDRLDAIHHQMEEPALTAAMEECGYTPVLRETVALPNGKALVRLDYRMRQKTDESCRGDAEVMLVPLAASDREQFIRDNQEAFNYGALEEFGLRDDRFEEEGEIISHDTVARAIDEGAAYRIMQDGKPVGGVVLRTEYDHGELELLFVAPAVHSRGIGYAAWCAVEEMHPEVTVWETVTPYFEKRNIHFYVNRCGFHIVAYYNEHFCAPDDETGEMSDMFAFEKILPDTPESLQAQIRRVTFYENIMQQAADGSPELLKALSDYYGSPAWKRDLAAEEAGMFPKDLRRGVLSEDGIFHLLEQFGC